MLLVDLQSQSGLVFSEGEMNVSPELLHSRLEKFRVRQELRAWSSANEDIGEALWAEKTCTFIHSLATVLAVARKDLAPEIEKVAYRLFFLAMLLFELFRCTTHR